MNLVRISFLLLFILLVGCTATQTNETSSDKKYVGNSLDECSRIKFMCETGFEYFSDDNGCGCMKSQEVPEEKKVTVSCLEKQRKADYCTADYEPVCGWFNEDIKCIKYPCANTYSNSCESCKDAQVEYWTDGECPA